MSDWKRPQAFDESLDPGEDDAFLSPASLTDAIDRELEAAIEYKICTAGVGGAATVLEFLDRAMRRHARAQTASPFGPSKRPLN